MHGYCLLRLDQDMLLHPRVVIVIIQNLARSLEGLLDIRPSILDRLLHPLGGLLILLGVHELGLIFIVNEYTLSLSVLEIEILIIELALDAMVLKVIEQIKTTSSGFIIFIQICSLQLRIQI